MNWKNVGEYFKGAVTTEKDADGKSTGQIKNPELLQGGISVVDQFLGSAANNMRYGKVTDPAQKEMLQAVYGDANEDPLMRLYGVINGSAMKEATTNISNQGNLIGSGVSSNQQLLEQSKNLYQANHLERDKFGMDNVADNLSAFGKGFTKGFEMSGGNWVAGVITGAGAGLANIFTQAGSNNRIGEMNKTQDLAEAQSGFNYAQAVDNTAKQDTINQLAMAAYGGFLRKYDLGGSLGDFNEVNAGGTHEQNPFGGVMVRPNASVEQGETIDDDYVFSDRLKLSKQECLDLGVPVGSTYAEASKILRKEYNERPNDPISKRGWKNFKNILIESQELQKQEKALKEIREQGLNSPKMQGVNPQVMQDMQYSGNPQEEALLQQGINPNISQAFGGYNQYGPGGFLEKVQNLMRSPEMRHAMSDANMARKARNYENITKVESDLWNNSSEENGMYTQYILDNSLLTTPQGDSTWIHNNERINGNNSQFNNINVFNNPLTGNYTYETYNGDTGNHVFEEEVPRNELPQEVLNIMNYDYSGNKKYRRGGYVRKFAEGSFLNPNTPPPEKNTYRLTTSDGHAYIYENVPADVYQQMVGNINSENVDIDAVFNHANNPNREWDQYLNVEKSRLPEGYVVNTPAAVPVQNNPVVPVNNDPNIDFDGDPEMPDVISTEDPYRMTRRQARKFMKDYLPFSSMEYKVNPLDGYALFPQPVENTSNVQNTTTPANTSVTPQNESNNNLVGPLSEDQMPTYGRGDGVFRYYNSDMGFEGSKIYTNGVYDSDYSNWLKNTQDFGQYFTEDARNQMLNRYNTTKGTNLNWESFNSKLQDLGSDNVYGYYTKMLENAYNQYLTSQNTPEVSETPEGAQNTNNSVVETDTDKNNNEKQGFNKENLRYASALGDISAAIHNIFAKPNYKYADRLDQMAQRINTTTPVPGNYNYMTYNPVDAQRYLNNYNAQANAVRQGIMNTTNPGRNAALLAAQYNDLSGRGDLMQAIEQVNRKNYNDTIVRNNAVNAQKNADALNIANANFTKQKYQLGLMQHANAVKQAEDEGLRAARSQQWSNALNSISKIGQDVSADNMARSWFELNRIAPGLTWEQFVKYSRGEGTLERTEDGKYKFV